MTRTRPIAALALGLALAAAAPFGVALASPDGGRIAAPGAAQAVTPGNAGFDAPAAVAAVYGAGYTAVTELEWERGGWDVKATDAEGRRVRLRVNPTTGAVAPRAR